MSIAEGYDSAACSFDSAEPGIAAYATHSQRRLLPGHVDPACAAFQTISGGAGCEPHLRHVRLHSRPADRMKLTSGRAFRPGVQTVQTRDRAPTEARSPQRSTASRRGARRAARAVQVWQSAPSRRVAAI